MKKIVFISISALVFCSCMQAKNQISKDRFIKNFLATKTVVLVPESRRFNYIVFPSGVYLSIAENDSGIYYLAPRQLSLRAGDFDGGIYLQYSDPSVPYYWVTVLGATYIKDPLPDDFQFNLVQRQ